VIPLSASTLVRPLPSPFSFGIGGLIYAALVRHFIYRLGQIGLTVAGGLVLATAYVALAVEDGLVARAIAVTAIGLGFYMFHNTLQTNAHANDAGSARHRRRDLLVLGSIWGRPQVSRGGRAGDRSISAPRRCFVGTAVGLSPRWQSGYCVTNCGGASLSAEDRAPPI